MIQFMRGSKSQLDSLQTILPSGQPVFEEDSGQLKIGNGSSIYSALPYVGASGAGSEYPNTYVDNSQPAINGQATGYIDFSSTLRLYFGQYSHTVTSAIVYSQAFNRLEGSGSLAINYATGRFSVYLKNMIPNYTGRALWCIVSSDNANYNVINTALYARRDISINYHQVYIVLQGQGTGSIFNDASIPLQYHILVDSSLPSKS